MKCKSPLKIGAFIISASMAVFTEMLHVRPEYIEHQLAHTVCDPNGRAYNRTAHLDERKKMMQQWGDYLDGLKAGAKILPFPKAAG